MQKSLTNVWGFLTRGPCDPSAMMTITRKVVGGEASLPCPAVAEVLLSLVIGPHRGILSPPSSVLYGSLLTAFPLACGLQALGFLSSWLPPGVGREEETQGSCVWPTPQRHTRELSLSGFYKMIVIMLV